MKKLLITLSILISLQATAQQQISVCGNFVIITLIPIYRDNATLSG